MKAKVKTKLKMMYWRGKKLWVGKLIDHPEIMTQGKTLEELEENIIDGFVKSPSAALRFTFVAAA